MRDNLRQARSLELCTAGIVLTGGGARLAHLAEVAETVLRKPARMGSPGLLPKLPLELASPEYSAAVGMTLYGNRVRQGRGAPSEGLAAKLKALFGRNGNS